MKIVLTAGTFDCPHLGHAIFLQRAAKLGDYLIVALGSDEYVERYKGKRPLFTYEERESLLYLMPEVDLIIKNEADSLKGMLLAYSPNILAIDSGWGDRYFEQIKLTRQELVRRGVVLVYLPRTPVISTTTIKERILQCREND